MRYILLLLTVLVCMAGTVQARPVSYPGGWTVMQMNDMDSNSLHVHYSPTAQFSIGYKAEYWREKEWQFHGIQVNHLVKRWNRPASQANIYLKGGAGIAYSDSAPYHQDTDAAGFLGVALDWEDRRFFTSYENRVMDAGQFDRFFVQKARVGIAPYIGDYGDLHSWLMLQVDHNPAASDAITLTPLVRFFKGPYLVEAGVSDKGDALFNWIVRF